MRRTRETTIAAPRADWMLLRMHYLRVLAPLAAVCFGTLAMFWLGATIVQRLRGDAGEIGEVLDFTAILLSALVALPSGAAVFSRPFKEQHLIFFHSLPMRRLRQWLVLSGASLLALLTVYAGFGILRPGAIAVLRSSGTMLVFVFGVAIAFAAGVCFALVFTRTVVVYIAAHVAAVIAPLAAALALLAPGLAFERSPIPLEGDRAIDMLFSLSNRVPVVFVLTSTVVLIVVLVAASAAFYVRGEVTLPRVQFLNAAIVAAALVAIVLTAALAVYELARGPMFWSSWRLSPDGRRAARFAQMFDVPWRSRLHVFDLVSGNRTESEVVGLVEMLWTKPDELVTFTRDVSPLRRLAYLLPAKDRVTRWSATGAKLAESRQDGVVESFSRGPNGELRIAVLVGDQASVRELRADGSHRELLRAPASDSSILDGDVLILDSPEGARVWRLESGGAREIRRVPIASRRDQILIFGDAFYPTLESLLQMIDTTMPPPRGADDRVGYAVYADMRFLYALVAHPATSNGTLHVLDPASRRWSKIADDIPLGEREMPKEKVGRFESTPTISIAYWRNRAVFARVENGATVFRLHDARTGVVTPLYTHPPNDPRKVRMDLKGLLLPRRGLAISFSAGDTTVAEFLSTDAGITPLRHLPPGDLLAVLPDGSQVRERGSTIRRFDANGAPAGMARQPQ